MSDDDAARAACRQLAEQIQGGRRPAAAAAASGPTPATASASSSSSNLTTGGGVRALESGPVSLGAAMSTLYVEPSVKHLIQVCRALPTCLSVWPHPCVRDAGLLIQRTATGSATPRWPPDATNPSFRPPAQCPPDALFRLPPKLPLPSPLPLVRLLF